MCTCVHASMHVWVRVKDAMLVDMWMMLQPQGGSTVGSDSAM